MILNLVGLGNLEASIVYDVHAVEKLFGWELELNHHGKSPDLSTTDCATIQPMMGYLFSLIFFLQVRTQQQVMSLRRYGRAIIDELIIDEMISHPYDTHSWDRRK